MTNLGNCEKCGSPLTEAPGIEVYCSNKECDQKTWNTVLLKYNELPKCPVCGQNKLSFIHDWKCDKIIKLKQEIRLLGQIISSQEDIKWERITKFKTKEELLEYLDTL